MRPSSGSSDYSKTGKFRPISNKNYWTMDKVSVKFDKPNYPSLSSTEACFSETSDRFVSFKDATSLDQFYKDACGPNGWNDCKDTFDPSKLPNLEITIDGTTQTVKPEDYLAWKFISQKTTIHSFITGVSDLDTIPFGCPPTTKLVLGRLFLRRFRTTFRAARNGAREVAVEGFGKVQYPDPPKSEPVNPSSTGSGLWIVLILILIGGGIGFFFYNKSKNAATGGEYQDPSFSNNDAKAKPFVQN